MLSDLTWTREALEGLHAMDVEVAIDDFGTGFSSLSHLKALPVGTLKIDKGFVMNLDTNPEDRAIVKSIIGLAESFGLELVAEGVENVASARQLIDMGCHRAQGFLFSRPVSAEKIGACWWPEPSRSVYRRPRGCKCTESLVLNANNI